MRVSKSDPVLGLTEVQGGEEFFTQVCAPKKVHYLLEYSRKLREAGSQFSQKWHKLVCFPVNIPKLGFESRFALEVNKLHLKP